MTRQRVRFLWTYRKNQNESRRRRRDLETRGKRRAPDHVEIVTHVAPRTKTHEYKRAKRRMIQAAQERVRFAWMHT